MKDQSNKPADKKQDTPQGPDALQPNATPVDPETRNHSNSGGNQTQNLNQNMITESGNPIKNNTPGGNFNTVRSARANKPRSNPNPSQQKNK
ncbi:hypothetical protein [Hymenobacter weizhouensis]|uniref:hypothetical protein n=1 Tax=Hymenobacter sp. YIM 151500-1 TaxID=2987689 RepID=UPI0022266808|nr:hypothetical protein [Hymenobacter sp. YIM 151500-1]UYZ61738.1 hypothetical protein OIS53_12070 [Hymenobacter sp. YIM 151500-1]